MLAPACGSGHTTVHKTATGLHLTKLSYTTDKKAQIYYRSRTGIYRCCCTGSQALSRCCLHSPGGSNFLYEMTSWSPSWKHAIISWKSYWKYDYQSICNSVFAWSKSYQGFILIRFEMMEPYCFYWLWLPQQQEEQEQEEEEEQQQQQQEKLVNSNMRSVPDYQSMCIYSKNNPAKFHPNPIWNEGGLGFFEKHRPKQQQQQDEQQYEISSWSKNSVFQINYITQRYKLTTSACNRKTCRNNEH